ncbi:BT_3044 domain-containing protein [Coprobacter fastidiosus]|uniref:Uncharacterized protein DUF1735 n=1 Tax=Coprobacter fastidiosus NSB1 = JCM 33896 TaxID=1349822 RepID=A0A495WGV2_9BACT|nr:DUF4361 domain-containing protein [Coprobacter fastidiosus]ERM88987.1 hypothetical protein NSB1T_12020 [Coprobacter fastidiosus NSB1 = JCM 33896]RKT60025.1 uncharacterized protein DUF1735 [Coprobacter fastidiosus NSB1 = JCM 33896]BEG62371.1 DUF4361 domain-containing protein [Coprobacter fastidiosus]
MKKILNIGLLLLTLAGITGCNEDEQFEGELYKKIIYLLSDDNMAFQSAHELGKESTGYVSVCCGGTEHIKQDVTIELEPDDQILAQYNKINFDIEESKYAKELDPSKYNIPTYQTVLKADSEDNYALIPITVNPDGLSPDSIYMIPLRIKSISNYEINPDKQQVLYQVVLKNEYATMESTTYYQTSGTEIRHTTIGDKASGTNVTRVVAPISKSQVRVLAGTHTYSPTNVTKEEIDKYAMILTINDDYSITITPYGSLQMEMIGGAEDNYWTIDKKGRYVFNLHYKYFDNITVTDTNNNNNTWTEDCWITMEEKSVQSL